MKRKISDRLRLLGRLESIEVDEDDYLVTTKLTLEQLTDFFQRWHECGADREVLDNGHTVITPYDDCEDETENETFDVKLSESDGSPAVDVYLKAELYGYTFTLEQADALAKALRVAVDKAQE